MLLVLILGYELTEKQSKQRQENVMSFFIKGLTFILGLYPSFKDILKNFLFDRESESAQAWGVAAEGEGENKLPAEQSSMLGSIPRLWDPDPS